MRSSIASVIIICLIGTCLSQVEEASNLNLDQCNTGLNASLIKGLNHGLILMAANTIANEEKLMAPCLSLQIKAEKISERLRNMGDISLREGRFSSALQYYQSSLDLDEGNGSAWYGKGVALGNLGIYNKAVSCFNSALRYGRNHPDTWDEKGQALANMGLYFEALSCFDKAIGLNASYAQAWSNKGESLYHYGKYEDAISCFDKAIELDPKYAEAWFNKGRALATIGKDNDADDAFARAEKLGYI